MKQPYYTNPVIDADFPDPSIIAVPGSGYFAYATHDEFSPTINNILVRHSPDLIHWSEAKGALAEPPTWAKRCQRFWCPDVHFINDEFCLYYAAEPDTKDGMCLALAVSNTPNDFADIGTPLSRRAGSTYQMIDPCFFADPKSGQQLLYYGSAHEPIRVVKLSADGRTIISEPKIVLMPDENTPFERLREGAFVTYNKDFDRYFLYVSGDNTWTENGYAVSVFWSHDPVKAFVKIPGDHIILKGSENWDAPGQCCILKDAAGDEWMFYHAVDTKERFIKGTDRHLRKMCMDKIRYTEDGWPFIEGGVPSFEVQQGPEIKAANGKAYSAS
jgi:arabinan endo-1,5-alpha-L-arabinosidase